MNHGTDDLLFGHPNNLEEAVDTLIAFYGEVQLQDVLRGGITSYESKPLYGVAEFVRNNWFLWWHPNYNTKQYPAIKPPLLRFFHDVGITHPDDMTDIIFSAILHRFNNKPFDLTETVECLQAYWKEQGYPDGKPDVSSM